MKLSLILPLYNQYANIDHNFGKIYDELRHKYGGVGFELILVNDGSTDSSERLLYRLSRLKGVQLISKRRQGGRGAAIKDAVAMARGDVIGYMDVDLSVPLPYMHKAVRMVLRGNKVVVGSRYIKGAAAARSPVRLVESKLYNILINLAFNTGISDHQCGFKFWDAKYIRAAARRVRDDHWFFDTEMLVDARAHGLSILEIPVSWSESEETTTSPGDIVYFIECIIRHKLRSI